MSYLDDGWYNKFILDNSNVRLTNSIDISLPMDNLIVMGNPILYANPMINPMINPMQMRNYKSDTNKR